jgi:hypothetical protein
MSRAPTALFSNNTPEQCSKQVDEILLLYSIEDMQMLTAPPASESCRMAHSRGEENHHSTYGSHRYPSEVLVIISTFCGIPLQPFIHIIHWRTLPIDRSLWRPRDCPALLNFTWMEDVLYTADRYFPSVEKINWESGWSSRETG